MCLFYKESWCKFYVLQVVLDRTLRSFSKCHDHPRLHTHDRWRTCVADQLYYFKETEVALCLPGVVSCKPMNGDQLRLGMDIQPAESITIRKNIRIRQDPYSLKTCNFNQYRKNSAHRIRIRTQKKYSTLSCRTERHKYCTATF